MPRFSCKTYRSTGTISCRQALRRTDYEDGLHTRRRLLYPQSGTAPGVPTYGQMGQNAPPLPGNVPPHSLQSAHPRASDFPSRIKEKARQMEPAGGLVSFVTLANDKSSE